MSNATDGALVELARLREKRSLTREFGQAVPEERAPLDRSAALVHVETLSRYQFMRQLQVEKRRTDRTKSPLSLVVVSADSERGGGFRTINELLDLLRLSKRETDILGHISSDCVGLLLPHTSEQGVEAFIKSISRRIAHLPISIASGTYPDHLFDKLLCESNEQPTALTYFLDEPTKRNGLSCFVKRTLDFVGALTAIVVFSPLMLATAIAVAVTSPGPVIFRQTRLGKRGVPFVFYKFRSMRTNMDDRIHREYVADLIQGNLEKINQGDGTRPLYKLTSDPRVTPVGRFIRRTSLDELPQLFNVLKGDMSLVGPRPPLPYEAEKYQSWHLRRVLEIRPGITGLWQVEGRSTTSFDDMVRLDLRYIRQCSLWLDLKILLKTVRVLFGARGAT